MEHGVNGTALVPPHGGAIGAINDPAALDAEIGAASRQIARGVDDLVDGSLRLAIALARMRATGGYRSLGYDTFERYCRERHGITDDTARFYMLPLETLGADAYRGLLQDYGRRRAYYLAQVYRLDPAMFDLLTAADGAARPAAAALAATDLERLVSELRRQANDALARALDAEGALRREQALGRTLSSRLAQLEEINHALMVERDQEARERRRLEEERRRLEEERRSWERGALPPPAAAAPAPVPVGGGMPAGMWAMLMHGLAQHAAPEAAAAVWTAAATLIERGAWSRPDGVPPLAVIAAALRRLAQDVVQRERSGGSRRAPEEGA